MFWISRSSNCDIGGLIHGMDHGFIVRNGRQVSTVKISRKNVLWISMVLLVIAPLLALGTQCLAGSQAFMVAGYHVNEDSDYSTPSTDVGTRSSNDFSAGQGPVRLARFSFVQGNVTCRTSESDQWSAAAVNLPLREGAQVWVSNGGRAEIQFDDGSMLRLGNGAVITMQTLYSDSDGEFTEVKVNEGLTALHLRNTKSIYQLDTPYASIKSEGPANLRVGIDNSVEIAVRNGSAVVHGNGGEASLRAGDYLDLADENATYVVDSIPGSDSWDEWNDSRDRELADMDSQHYLPSNISIVAGNLNSYGNWRYDVEYGYVWCPVVHQQDWRPYRYGRWVWVDPFGWTWVSSEPWGWAPYHYGTWVCGRYGWAWVPGPVTQYWCPAVVHFTEYNGVVAWAPLAPREVRYPSSMTVAFRGGNWSAFFSIGGTAVYYPHDSGYCVARPWNNAVINRVAYVNKVTNITNVTTNYLDNRRFTNQNVYLTKQQFVPVNSRYAGVTTASLSTFGGRGDYKAESRSGNDIFLHGHGIGAPPQGADPKAGPLAVHATSAATSPSREFERHGHIDMGIFRRPVVRTPLPARIEHGVTQGADGDRVRLHDSRTYPWQSGRNSDSDKDRARNARDVLSGRSRNETNQPELQNGTPRYQRTDQSNRVGPWIIRKAPSDGNAHTERSQNLYHYRESTRMGPKTWTGNDKNSKRDERKSGRSHGEGRDSSTDKRDDKK